VVETVVEIAEAVETVVEIVEAVVDTSAEMTEAATAEAVETVVEIAEAVETVAEIIVQTVMTIAHPVENTEEVTIDDNHEVVQKNLVDGGRKAKVDPVDAEITRVDS
jgi:hypothetical protein